VTGLKPYFTGFISGDEVTKNKPAPDIYLHALSKAQAKKEKAVVFEDAPTGIIAGAKAGIDVIAVPDLIPLDKDTQALAKITVPNLSAVLPFFYGYNR
ncbi:MAG TPA: HAD family hydrolase, partial [Candidatus Ligilactobacillus excrementavium]|nr:HAD family hydrolase [Candidatus Ligilactobacillus excrementavium]